jgi:cell division septal protein FtsQ
MARKPKKHLKPVVVWLLVAINVTCGLVFSPITDITRLHVVGAKAFDKSRIEHELQWLQQRPSLSVNKPSVEEQILRNPLVKTADLSLNIFGHGELKVTYYEPVAILQNAKNCVLTNVGTICPMAGAPADLPSLTLYPEGSSPNFSITAPWEPTKVAEICIRAFKQGIIKNLSITVTRNGSVCLNSGVTGRVDLGAPDELDEKFEQIRKILSSQPDLLAQGKELVLIAPSKPVTRPLQGNL